MNLHTEGRNVLFLKLASKMSLYERSLDDLSV